MWDKIRTHITKYLFVVLVLIALIGLMKFKEYQGLQKLLLQLSSEERLCQIIVTESKLNEVTGAIETMVKVQEYDVTLSAMTPAYFSLRGGVLHVQAMSIRLEDEKWDQDHPLQDKNIQLFVKIYFPGASKNDTLYLSNMRDVPESYRVIGVSKRMQERIWKDFWKHALSPKNEKNLQIHDLVIKADNKVFLPGTVYQLRILPNGKFQYTKEPVPKLFQND